MLFEKHKSYIYIALFCLLALASVALPKQAIAFEFSVPTEVNAVLIPDGAVVNSSFSTGINTSEDPLAVSGDLSLNDGFKGSLIFNNQNNTKDIEVDTGDKIDGSIDITKIDNSLDYSKKNIIGSINWSIQPKIKTAFAIYSADDDSLNFYKRSSVPKAGEQFEGKIATAVYTGIETDRYKPTPRSLNAKEVKTLPWEEYSSKIKNVKFVDKIKPISTAFWFQSFNRLTKLDLTNLDTSSLIYTHSMFSGCENLIYLNLANFNTENVRDMSSMFFNCYSLTFLDLSNFNTSAVTNMHAMFQSCYSLTSLNLSSFDTSAVTDMGGMFYGCPLTSLNLSNFNTSAVTDMSDMFAGCSSLTSLNLFNFNTSAVTDMSYMFEGCSSLTSINLSSFDTSAVTDMGGMFINCSKLACLDLSNFNTSKVTTMYSMFEGCSSLTSLDLSSFDTSSVKYSNNVFNGCFKLQQVKLGDKFAWNGTTGYLPTPSSSYIPGADGKWYAMSDGIGYTPKNIPSNKADTYVASHNLLPKPEAFAVYSADDQSLNFYKRSSVPKAGEQFEGKTATEVYTGIETNIYTTYTKVPWYSKRISITNSTVVDVIKPVGTTNWFFDCTSLTSLNLSNLDTSNVRNMSNMFYFCTSLTSLNLSNLDTSNVRDMSGMFYLCTSLTSLDLSSFNTSFVTNMSSMFNGCTSLTSLNLSNLDTLNVSDMNGMFNGCTSLTSLDLSSFKTSFVTNMEYMFSGSYKLQQVKLGDKFAWKSANGYLPSQNATHIPGADGKWYAMSDKKGYAPADIPSNKADTYVASPDLLPKPEAFAVYSADDQSLDFYKRIRVPKAGEQFEGKTATEVYTGIEKLSSLFMPWSQHKTSITNSTVIDTIKPISTSNWFSNFTALTTADLSKMDTSATNNMQRMFFNCTSLTSLNLSGLDTSNVVLMDEMFNYCSSLTSLNLSSFNTSKVTSMREMFRGCRSLTSLDLSSFNTSKVTNMREMFQSCSNLTSIDLSSFNTSSVTRMEQMFSYCSSLTSLDLSHFNTSNVTLMDYMFEDCSSLTSLNLSNFDTSNVTTMFFMFDDCSSLTTLDISMFDNHLVSEMSNMFNKCYKLQQIKLGNKFSWKGNEGYLPTPSSSYIPGADGNWYAMSDSKGYAPADIPSNKADTYYASKDLLPKMTGNIQISGSNSPGSTLSAIVEGVPSNANIGYQWYIGVGSKDFEYVVTDIFIDDGVSGKVGEATLSDKDVILFKGEETKSYSIDAEIINSSGAVVFKKTFNENSNSAYFKPSESGVYKVKVRLTSGSTYFEATKRALEFEEIDGETSQSLNILDNQEYRTFMCKAFDKSGKYLGEISSEKVTITPKTRILK